MATYHRFRPCLVVLASIVPLALASTISAQTTAHRDSIEGSPLGKGTRALQFSFGGHFNLSGLDGGLISIKTHFSDRQALRIGLSVNAELARTRSERIKKDTVESAYEDSPHAYYSGAVAYFIRYPSPNLKMKLYYGLGPRISINKLGGNGGRHTISPVFPERRIRRQGWSVGVAGILGVEWFPFESISLAGEYRLRIEYFNFEYYSTSMQPDGTLYGGSKSGRSLELNDGPTRLIVSFYF